MYRVFHRKLCLSVPVCDGRCEREPGSSIWVSPYPRELTCHPLAACGPPNMGRPPVMAATPIHPMQPRYLRALGRPLDSRLPLINCLCLNGVHQLLFLTRSGERTPWRETDEATRTHWAWPKSPPPAPRTEGSPSPPWLSSPAQGAKTWRRAEASPVAFYTFSPTMAADAALLFGSGTVALSHRATSLGWVVLSAVRGHWPLVLMGCGAAGPQDLTPRPADPSRSPGDARVVPGPPGPLSGLLPASASQPPGPQADGAEAVRAAVPKSKQTPGANWEPAGRRTRPQGAAQNVPLGRG